jgi:hypothetical protein
MDAMRQRMEDLEHVAGDDYKFLYYFDIFTMEDEPERLALDVNQGEHFVNSFYFLFLEFLAKFY